MAPPPPPPPPPSRTVAGGAAGGGGHPSDGMLQGLDNDDDGCLQGATAIMGAEAERERRLAVAQAAAAAARGGRVEDGLSMTYRGHTNKLVYPVVVPQDFDRAAAISRYRMKRKSIIKANCSVQREIASRTPRRGGKFAPSSGKSSENSVGETAELIQSCANCGESSEVTPMMRRGPNGDKNFCNACGLMWATTGKIRKLTNVKSQHGGGH